ncbi:hypothetical protein [Microcoleus sp. S13_D1]
MKEGRLNIRVSQNRAQKLKRIAVQREKTITQMIEDWSDKLKEEKPS